MRRNQSFRLIHCWSSVCPPRPCLSVPVRVRPCLSVSARACPNQKKRALTRPASNTRGFGVGEQFLIAAVLWDETFLISRKRRTRLK